VWLALLIEDAKDMSLAVQDPYQRQIGEIKVDGGGVFATFGVPEVTLWKVGESRSFQVWYGLTAPLLSSKRSSCDSAVTHTLCRGHNNMCPPQLPNNMSYKTSGEFLSHSSALAVTDSYDKPFAFVSSSTPSTHPPALDHQKRAAVLLSDPAGVVGPNALLSRWILSCFFSSTLLFLKRVYSPTLALLTWPINKSKEKLQFFSFRTLPASTVGE
jgi:hypothetical protein